MTFTAPVFSVGWFAALVLFIVALLLWGLGAIPKEWALLICAACSIRL
jgi:hypothetical protein